MVRGLIMPPHALFPPPQAQPPVLQGILSSSIPPAMPSIKALSMSPGLICPHRIKGDTPQSLGKPAELMTRCFYQYHHRRAQQTLTLSALKVPMLSSERGTR